MPKILVADDNAAMARLVSATLPETYEVVHARDGDEALRKARRFIPDLIILDVNMPGLNGFEVLQKIRSSEGLKHAKVIMVTARDQAGDQAFGIGLGADTYITKPFSPMALLEAVTELLGGP
jgi:DNA-binding response OmpR family regulator